LTEAAMKAFCGPVVASAFQGKPAMLAIRSAAKGAATLHIDVSPFQVEAAFQVSISESIQII
jgi:hypothetical protein